MILLLYNCALLLALLLGSPWWLFRMATTHKYREGLRHRLGAVPTLKGKSNKPLIWIHAVSVGEVLAITRLVQSLEIALPDHFIAISTTTQTGQQLAQKRFGTNRVFYCPLDLPWAVSAYLDRIEPTMLILAETEFWPNLLSGCYKRQIPVAVVNARISDRSWPRYLHLRSLWKPFLERLSLVLAQAELDATRLKALGCDPDRVSTVGNLKFDIKADPDTPATELLRNLCGDLQLLVAGSTLEGEEAILLSAWPELLASHPHLAMILAPRHPERFEAVTQLLSRSGHPWRKRSAASIQPLVPGEILLLDTIGELASLYSLAAVAFIGGSLIPAGGHNPLEPAQFGIPIVMGPHYANFRVMVQALQSHQAIQITEPSTLSQIISSLLSNPTESAAMGERGQQLFNEQAGATGRTLEALKALLGTRGER